MNTKLSNMMTPFAKNYYFAFRYFVIAMIIHPNNRIKILSAECDFVSVHMVIANLPKAVHYETDGRPIPVDGEFVLPSPRSSYDDNGILRFYQELIDMSVLLM